MEAMLPEVLSSTIAINADLLMGLEVVVFAITLMGGALLGQPAGVVASIFGTGDLNSGDLSSGGGTPPSNDGVGTNGRWTGARFTNNRFTSDDNFTEEQIVGKGGSKGRVKHPGGPFLFTFNKPSLANQRIVAPHH